MSLCARLRGGPKSNEELWSSVNEIAEKGRSTAGDIFVKRESKWFQGVRDETIYVSRSYDSGIEFAFKFEKIKRVVGRPEFRVFAHANGSWKQIPSVSDDMRQNGTMREFDLYNYSLLLMLNCE